jgi:hypothetical protein
MPPNDPFKLDYRDGAQDLTPARATAGAFIGGVVCGVIGTAMIGFGVSASVFNSVGTGGRSGPSWAAVIGFGLAALGGLIGAIYFLGRSRRRMFLAGLLLGIMIVSMIESACFYQA